MKNFLLLIISTIISIAIAEIITTQFFNKKSNNSSRVLMYSSPSFSSGQKGVVKYVPNTKIRSVAIYGNNIEYDITKRTNNLGFYDVISYDQSNSKGKGIVFVGDSFTAGEGGSNNWVTQIRDKLLQSNLRIYNLGVSATGIHHFHNLLKYFKNEIPFDEVNIMVISQDFYRKLWYPLENNEGIWFCYKDLDCPHTSLPIIYNIKQTTSDAALVEKAAQSYRNKYNHLKFYQKMGLYKLYSLYFHRKRESRKKTLYTESIKKLKIMADYFPNVRFRLFHIPQKSEVQANQYSVNLTQDIKNERIEYIPLLTRCNWNTDMYYKHDAHPNDIGYENLTQCMLKFIH